MYFQCHMQSCISEPSFLFASMLLKIKVHALSSPSKLSCRGRRSRQYRGTESLGLGTGWEDVTCGPMREAGSIPMDDPECG